MSVDELRKQLIEIKESCLYHLDDEYGAGFFDGINKVIQLIDNETQRN